MLTHERARTHDRRRQTRIGDPGLSHLAGLTRLERLNLDYTAVTDEGLEALSGLASLESLSLDAAEVTDGAVGSLSALSSLKILNLYHTLVSEEGFEQLRGKLPDCEIIWDRDSTLPNRRTG